LVLISFRIEVNNIMKGGSAAIMIAQVLQVQQAASGSGGVPANAAYIYDSSTGLVITYALIYSI
jgi:hypothetical protein